MATWRTGHGVDTVGNISEANIDTWWATKDRTVVHGFDDAEGYIRNVITAGIPAGHTVKHGAEGGEYFLTISGSTINKTWNA
jgi:hypothetical protein